MRNAGFLQEFMQNQKIPLQTKQRLLMILPLLPTLSDGVTRGKKLNLLTEEMKE